MNLQVFEYIIYLHNLVINLAVMLYGKIILLPRRDEPIKKKYRKLKVDILPKIENIEKLDFKEILQKHLKKKLDTVLLSIGVNSHNEKFYITKNYFL